MLIRRDFHFQLFVNENFPSLESGGDIDPLRKTLMDDSGLENILG